jgi:integrating conjugative element membrane protein (TIGR03745 family)
MQGSRHLMLRLAALAVLMVLIGVGLPEALAVLPTPVAPSTSPASGDWLGLIQGYAKDAGIVLGLIVSVAGFIWVAYTGFAKFNDARRGKAEWGEVALLGVAGAGVLIFASFLLDQASKII